MARPSDIEVHTEVYRALAIRFSVYQHQMGYTPRSIRARYNNLREYLSWLEQRGQPDIRQVDRRSIDAYYDYIRTRPSKHPQKSKGSSLSEKTIYSHMQVVRDLFEMLLREGRISVHPMSGMMIPYPKHREERSILSQSEISVLYRSCETAQERAILSMAYGCGLRVGELTRCRVEDVRLKDKILIVPDGKGRKRRAVPMSAGVAEDLNAYYLTERVLLSSGRDYAPKANAFMLNSRGGRMNQWTYNKYLKRIMNRSVEDGHLPAEVLERGITIHNLRHSIGTHLIEQGLPVDQVRQFLGHSQLETTQLYTHISRVQLKKLME